MLTEPTQLEVFERNQSMAALLLLIDGILNKVTGGAYVGWLNYVEKISAKLTCQ